MNRAKNFINYLWDNFYDHRFHDYKLQYMGQCLLVSAAIALILISLNIVPNAAVIASIGSTCFVIFAMPHKKYSAVRYVIGGYIIGMCVGSSFHAASIAPWTTHLPFVYQFHREIFGAAAIGFSIFFMVVLNVEHPPAAGLALGLVFDQWRAYSLLVTTVAIFLILCTRKLLRPYIRDLL